jgi:hypothetical protein
MCESRQIHAVEGRRVQDQLRDAVEQKLVSDATTASDGADGARLFTDESPPAPFVAKAAPVTDRALHQIPS